MSVRRINPNACALVLCLLLISTSACVFKVKLIGESAATRSGAATTLSTAGNETVPAATPDAATPSPSPTVATLEISPISATVLQGDSQSFSASGGTPPYSYAISLGTASGSVDPSSGLFTASSTTGSAFVTVSDHDGSTATALVTVSLRPFSVPIPTISMTLPSLDNFVATAIGGIPPYGFSIQAGLGAVHPTTGTFTQGAATGTTSIAIQDSLGTSGAVSIENIRFRSNGSTNALLHVGSSWYIGGSFTAVNLTEAPHFLGLNFGGKPFGGCNMGAGFNGDVRAIAVSGNSLYIGGAFTTYQGAPANYLTKVNATTCALDTTFNPPANNGFDSSVYALTIAGGSLYVGGWFTAYKGVANSANYLAKLDPTSGAIDTTFSPAGAATNGFSNGVSALAVSGSSLYVGGWFTAYKGVANSARRLTKLDLTSGAIDTTFSPPGATANGFDGEVKTLTTSESSLYVGGAFNAYQGVANSARRVAKLNLTSGAIDTTFSPVGATANGFDNDVKTLAISESSLYVGGTFNAYQGVANSAHSLAKLNLTSGAIDTTFSPVGATANGFDGGINAVTIAGGSLYAIGNIYSYRGVTGSTPWIAKLDSTSGVLDSTFGPTGTNLRFDSDVYALSVSGNSIYVGGAFTNYGGQAAQYIAKLDDLTFALDTTFSPPASNGFNGVVKTLVESGGALYVGGSFTTYRGVADSANSLAKLDLTSGAIDTTFSPVGATANGFDNTVNALATSGGALYVGGIFYSYKGVSESANCVAKLDLTSGAIDTTFSPPGRDGITFFPLNGFDNGVNALAISGSSLYVGGSFNQYKGEMFSANNLAKLDLTSGAIDTTFSPVGGSDNGFTSSVMALAISGTSLYVGGQFMGYRADFFGANRLAKLDLTSGAIDTTFSPSGMSNNGFEHVVLSLAVSGTSLYVGGWFNAYKGVANSANNLAKLDLTSGAIDTTFSPVGTSTNGFNDGFASVTGLAISGTTLFVGGSFSAYRGGRANRLIPIHLTTGQIQD